MRTSIFSKTSRATLCGLAVGCSEAATTGQTPETCPLPPDDQRFVSLISTRNDANIFYALRANGELASFSNGFPLVPYPLGEEANVDNGCLSTIDVRGRMTIGVSGRGAFTLADWAGALGYELAEDPYVGKVAGAVLRDIKADRDLIALDTAGRVWVSDEEGLEFSTVEPVGAVSQIVQGFGYCLLEEEGSVWCDCRDCFDTSGRFGFGIDAKMEGLTKLGLPFEVVDVGLDDTTLCVLSHDGDVLCAGSNKGGGLGVPVDPDAFYRGTFDTVPGLPKVERLFIGGNAVCGLANEGDLWCWGTNSVGKLDPPPEPPVTEGTILPRKVGQFPNLRSVAFTTDSTCVLREDSQIVCRGGMSLNDGFCPQPDRWSLMTSEPCE